MKTFSTILYLILVVSELKLTSCAKVVSHEDIRDAIIHVFKENTDKLERHENRERHLGEQLKKALSTMDKRERAQALVIDTIVNKLSKIEERLQGIEIAVSNKTNYRDRGMYTIDTINLQSWMEEKFQQSQDNVHLISKDELNALHASVKSRLDSMASTIEGLEANLIRDRSKNVQLDSEKLYHKIEAQISAQMQWYESILAMMLKQEKLLSDLNGKTGMESNENLTTEIQSLKYVLSSELRGEITRLENNNEEIRRSLKSGQSDIIQAIMESNDMAANFFELLRNSNEKMGKELKVVPKIEAILIQTADNVMDTKRRVEYVVQQILLEVGDLIKLQGKDLNSSMNQRFDGISNKILDNQNGGLTNLSSKIETEISQVWRQIGIMYQTLTTSAGALSKLQEQTETYVNGSLQTMNNMEGKVGLITSRMTEVDENLNYLLGRLSLVNHEFNQIKTALGTALDKFRHSVKDVQKKIEDNGAGPNPIDSNNQSDDDNILLSN